MTTLPRELQYLRAQRQVEDTRRLQAAWQSIAQREARVRTWPWLLRGGAGLLALGWLVLAFVWIGPVAACLGFALFCGGWAGAEQRFRLSGTTPPLGWELDRLNPQFEGAFSLLELVDAAAPPLRARYVPVLEVTLARVDWTRGLAAPDRRAERRRLGLFLAGLGAAAVLGALSLWLLHIPAQAADPGPALAAAAPKAVAPLLPASPQIQEYAVRIEPPTYTRLPVQENFLTTIQAPAGSKVTLRWRVECAGPAQSWLELGDRQLSTVQRGGPCSAVLDPTQPSGAFAVVAQSGDLYTRLPLFLTWHDDLAPRVEVNIGAKVERDREGVPFELHAEDDYGLTRLECIVATQPNGPGATVRVETFPLPVAIGADSFHGSVHIPNAVVEKLRQDRLRVQVKAYDTRVGADGAPAPNVGASEPHDFLVIQPWDNTHKPRSLEHKSGANGDEQNPSDSNQGSGGGTGPGPQQNDGPRMLQKHGDEPPGPQQQPPGPGENSPYSGMAGAAGDQPKQENQPQNGSNHANTPPPQANPNQPPTPNGPQPSPNPQDPSQARTQPNSTGGEASTDGAKNPEAGGGADGSGASHAQPNAAPDPKGQGQGQGQHTGSSTPGNGAPPSPGAGTPNTGNTGPGGGAPAGRWNNQARGIAASDQTEAGGRGNAAADTGVTARSGAVSVQDALDYAHQRSLGAWQRDFGGAATPDRLVQNDSGGAAAGSGGDPVQRGVTGAAALSPDSRSEQAAERLRIDTQYADLVEQYLLRVRSTQPATAQPK